MATILNATYRQTQEWTRDVESAREDVKQGCCSQNLVDRMVQQGISRTTGILANPRIVTDAKSRQAAKEIIDLLAKQAATLPISMAGPGAEEYNEKINRCANSAPYASASAMSKRLETLRLEGYTVVAQNTKGIVDLISAKERLQNLASVFKFCCDVEKLAKELKPYRGSIDALLRRQSSEIGDLQGFQALDKAKEQLAELDVKNPRKFLEDLPQPGETAPSEKAPSKFCGTRAWSWVTGAGASAYRSIASLFARIAGR